MIGKVTRGRDLGGLLRYLFGPGRANEHIRPHLVASWRGDDSPSVVDLEPVCRAGRLDVADLTARILLPLQLQPDIDRPVWQCSMRTAPGDRILTDAEWAGIARDVVHRTGFAAHGDDAACRWVAVRHADDHIHIAVVLARMDGHPVEVFRDWPKVHAAARAAERRLGLQIVTAPRRAPDRAPTPAEVHTARRTTAAPTNRQWLTHRVRDADRRSTSLAEFSSELAARGVLVTWRESRHTPGQVTGYTVGRPGDLDAAGQQVWFGGSKLAADLSLPRINARWMALGSSRPGRSDQGQMALPLRQLPGARKVDLNRTFWVLRASGARANAGDAVLQIAADVARIIRSM